MTAASSPTRSVESQCCFVYKICIRFESSVSFLSFPCETGLCRFLFLRKKRANNLTNADEQFTRRAANKNFPPMETRREEMVSNLSVGEGRSDSGQQRYLSCKYSFLENLKGTPESFIVNFYNCILSGDTAAFLERPCYEKWFRLSTNISLIMFRHFTK